VGVGQLRLRYCKKFNPFIISIAVLENVPPDAGLQKRATFSTLNVGLAGTGNQTRATCVASSVARRSAIHYAFKPRIGFNRRVSDKPNRMTRHQRAQAHNSTLYHPQLQGVLSGRNSLPAQSMPSK
jgi:hypothetical protein